MKVTVLDTSGTLLKDSYPSLKKAMPAILKYLGSHSSHTSVTIRDKYGRKRRISNYGWDDSGWRR